MPEPTDHRAEAEAFLRRADDQDLSLEDSTAVASLLWDIRYALIGIGHALLAEPSRELERPPYATVTQTAAEVNEALDAYWQRNR